MNVVFVASEAVPFAKTGGLADVIGSLPCALERLGHSVSLIIPCYREVWWRSGQEITSKGWKLWIPLGVEEVEARVHESRLPQSNVAVYLIDQPHFFDRDQLYQQSDGRDFPDNAARFAFFAKAALETIARLEDRPDVIHCHDWQAALVPAKLAEHYSPWMDGVGTLLTVHNLAYQGVFDAAALPLIGLDRRLFNWRQLEFHGRVNYLKAGLVYADRINTVSPTYAREIQTPEFGCGLDGLLRSRAADLSGIVNGIDTSSWNPATQPVLAERYDLHTFERGKAACKAALQRRAGLPERADVPLFAQIGRLDPQKGWDLLSAVADDLLSGDVQLVVLGQGQARYHERLEELAQQYPGRLRVFVEFSGPLAHQIEAGADLFLMPSLYEPCGLNQLYSLAHGTVPIVRATGGLCDTVVDFTPEGLADGTATGFVFHDPAPGAFREAIERALAVRANPGAWRQLIQNGMRADWSWQRSGRDYEMLYDEVRRHASARAGKAAHLAKAI